MTTHSSVLAWRIPWTEEPGKLQSIGSQRVRHYWGELAHNFKTCHLKRFMFSSNFYELLNPIKVKWVDFRGGTVSKDKNLPMQGACSIPRRIPHAAETLSLCTTITEPALWNPQKMFSLSRIICQLKKKVNLK